MTCLSMSGQCQQERLLTLSARLVRERGSHATLAWCPPAGGGCHDSSTPPTSPQTVSEGVGWCRAQGTPGTLRWGPVGRGSISTPFGGDRFCTSGRLPPPALGGPPPSQRGGGGVHKPSQSGDGVPSRRPPTSPRPAHSRSSRSGPAGPLRSDYFSAGVGRVGVGLVARDRGRGVVPVGVPPCLVLSWFALPAPTVGARGTSHSSPNLH